MTFLKYQLLYNWSKLLHLKLNFHFNLKFLLIFRNQVQNEMTSQQKENMFNLQTFVHFHLNFSSHRFQFLCKQRIFDNFLSCLCAATKKEILTHNTWINFKKEKKMWYLLESEEYKKCLQISKNKEGSSQLIKMNLKKKEWKFLL